LHPFEKIHAMNKQILKDSWKYLLLLLLVSLPLFLHLYFLTIRLWDEARTAINAYEMYHSGNYLVPTYNGEADMWNLKPPLMVWLQVFFMKLIGINEWSVRLPSALAALFTCVIIILISVRYIKSFWFGCFCVLVLVTSRGYVGYHAARTGDYDTLLTLFLTLANFAFFIFLENSKTKYLYLFFFSMILAVLTKNSAALMIVPGLFIYVVVKKKLLFLLKNKHLYIGLVIFLLISSGYFFLREIYNPGYGKAIWESDFGGRYLNTLFGHKHSFWYYFGNLFDHRFIIWVFFVPFGIYFGLKNSNIRIKNLTLFSSIIALTYFLFISAAQTKLFWYALPMYPFLAIFAGTCIYHIFSKLKEKKLKHQVLPYIVVGLIFITPYILMIQSLKAKSPNHDYEICNYLRNIAQGKIDRDDFFIIYGGTFFHGEFYINLLQEQGKNIAEKNRMNIKTGDIVLICQDEIKKYLEENYEYFPLEKYNEVEVYKITDRRENVQVVVHNVN
jgi:4-amino-4-deoxy-L-arabinose transferase-like glycosyltransferase